MKLAVPLTAPNEVELLREAGATEFYCGVQTKEWQDKFGDHDSISRRQGKANLETLDELFALVMKTKESDAPLFLTLNGSYTEEQLPLALKTAEAFEEMGGTGVMIMDIALLCLLKKRNSKLIRGLSLMAVVGSVSAMEFYEELDVRRVVFPRFLKTEQIGLITKRFPHIQAEVIVWIDKCRFIDGYCRFQHSVGYQDCALQREEQPQKCLYAYDMKYMLPACYELLGIPPQLPACAACYMDQLTENGVSVFKLGGRGRPFSIRMAGTRFLSEAEKMRGSEIKKIYRQTFGAPCNDDVCYYS